MNTKKLKYAHSIKLSFVKSVLDVWTKRNHKILHIGKHSAIEPTFFWDLGFDVTYLASSQEDLDERQEKNGQKIEYFLGQIDHLPFDDKVFDYAFIAHNFAQGHNEDDEKAILDELVRVSAKGICLVENNSFTCSKLKPCISSLYVQQLERHLPDDCQTEFYSTLYTPSIFWTKKMHFRAINAYPLKVPFGSLMALRIAVSGVPLTTLPITTMQTASDVV